MFEKLCTDLQKSVFWISKCFVFQTIHKCGELHFGIWRRCTEGCSRTAGGKKEKDEGNVPAPCWHGWEAWWGHGKMWRRIHGSGLPNAGQAGLPCWDRSPARPDPAAFSAGCVKKDSSAKWGNKDAPELLLQLLRRRFPGKTNYSTAARVKQRYVWKIRGTQTQRLAGAGPQAAARHRPPLQVSTQHKRLKRILSV